MSSPTEKTSVRTGRTRTGCLICRSRRVKCDEVKPTCRRCQRYGAECTYPAKRIYDGEEIASALARRHLKKNRTDEPVSSASCSNPTFPQDDTNAETGASRFSVDKQHEPLDLLIALGRNTRMGGFYIDSSRPPDFLKLAFPLEDDLKCIHHCITYSLSILVVEENANPWVEHVAPLFLFPTNEAPVSVAALRSAMLALGATHLSYLQKRSLSDEWIRTRQLASRYVDDALEACRAGRSIPEELASDTFLAACTVMLTVCVFAAEKSWKEVWRYALAAIKYRGGCSTVLGILGSVQGTPLLRCIVEQLAVTDLFAALGTGTSPIILDHNSGWWERLDRIDLSFEASRSVESRFGMDRRLVRYLATLADHVAQRIRLQQHTGSWLGIHSDGRIAEAREALETQTRSIQLELDAWHAQTSLIDKDSRTRLGSLAFWHACHILIHRDIEQATWTDETLISHSSAVVDLCIQSSDKIEYLNWPLLIASSVIQSSDERDRVRQLFKVFAYQCCYEIEVLSRIIEAIWERMDQGRDDEATSWREVMVETGCPVLLG